MEPCIFVFIRYFCGYYCLIMHIIISNDYTCYNSCMVLDIRIYQLLLAVITMCQYSFITSFCNEYYCKVVCFGAF